MPYSFSRLNYHSIVQLVHADVAQAEHDAGAGSITASRGQAKGTKRSRAKSSGMVGAEPTADHPGLVSAEDQSTALKTAGSTARKVRRRRSADTANGRDGEDIGADDLCEERLSAMQMSHSLDSSSRPCNICHSINV